MNLTEAIAQADWSIVEELHHIPQGKSGTPQRALRMEYAAYRRLHRQLGTKLPPSAALTQAVFNVRRIWPDFEPRYDAGFFFEGSHMSRTLAGDDLTAEIEAMAANGGDGVPSRHAWEDLSQDTFDAGGAIELIAEWGDTTGRF